ncbi:hypothetical protein MPTP_0968 [Melissococcus plutonius ATCC 35311]|uniref:Uncharacterized protein n=1 Tax=Melissococcus plutonius (strain ATCC 35311 / DSM 29964 / CIP 104052 / LMG 20360 / NCIMB 702443) TaxID=940190 RepID=F3YA99_MELPT|nr:hypothetical protein [Melissococcus plutonius]MBB5176810.1 hypothetical protein [Melissococcus plutonius]BAK21427.1 hypothetical protein MPTP_0968 [Melissococcus plutonius ATCC 35311]
MTKDKKVNFTWEKTDYNGYIEKEYENSYLVVVNNPSPDMEEKYTNRIIVSKKSCIFAE